MRFVLKKYIPVLILGLVLAAGSLIKPPAASAAIPVKTNSLLIPSQHLPNDELEGTHHISSPVFYSIKVKGSTGTEQAHAYSLSPVQLLLPGFSDRSSRVSLKAYLWFIYPSHNFW